MVPRNISSVIASYLNKALKLFSNVKIIKFYRLLHFLESTSKLLQP